MIFKVLYQPNMKQTPRRETTQALYIEADNEVIARETIRDNADYNIEYIEPLEGNHLEYEKQNPDFKLTKFGK